MTIAVWQVITWKPVRLSLAQWQSVSLRLRQIGASNDMPAAASGARRGQVLWGAEVDGQALGLAWDWAEVREHVPALADPMGILSNVSFLDERGQCLDESQRLVQLNNAVHGLGWQRCVVQGGGEARLAA